MSVTYHPKDARVKCPYYQCYNNRTLRCKSIFDNQIATNLSFCRFEKFAYTYVGLLHELLAGLPITTDYHRKDRK